MLNYNEEYTIRIDRSSIRYLCWVFVLINMYLEIPVTLPIIKSILGLPIILSLPILFYACKLKLRQSDINFTASIMVITLLSILSATNISTLPSYILKVFQFLFATVAGISTFKITSSIPYRKKYKTLLAISCIFIVGFVFEIKNIFFVRDISDYFRNFVYLDSVYGVYTAGDRDLELTGFVRPKFFTSEPSLAAAGYFIFSTAFLLVSKNYLSLWLILGLDILCVLFTGSPVSLLTFVIWAWIFSIKTVVNWPLVLITGSLFLGGILITLGPQLISGPLLTRLITETINPSTSLYSRLYVSYIEAIPNALNYNWFFGVGFAGKDILAGLTSQIVVDNDYQFTLGSNAFARFFIFFGLGGMALLLYTFHLFARKNNITHYGTLFMLWFLFSQMIGPIETTRYWMYLFLLVSLTDGLESTPKLKPNFSSYSV